MSVDTTPDEWISLIIARASALRAAGVRTLTIEGVSFTLDPAEPEPSKPERTDSFQNDPSDVFSDPATYGRLAGVPGFTRPKDE